MQLFSKVQTLLLSYLRTKTSSVVGIFLVRTWGTFWYQNNSDLLKIFDFAFLHLPLQWVRQCMYTLLRNVINELWRRLWRHLLALWRLMTINWSRYSVTNTPLSSFTLLWFRLKRGSSVVRHLPLVLEVPGSIPARGEKNFGVQTRFL